MAFNFSGFENKVGTKLAKHYKSFVGRDFKALSLLHNVQRLFLITISMTKREQFGLPYRK